MITQEQKNIIRKITGKYNPVFVAIFGSYARNDQSETSDLDLLIDFDSKINLLELIGLEQELSKLLGVKVDLVTMKSLDKRLQPHIEKNLIRIL